MHIDVWGARRWDTWSVLFLPTGHEEQGELRLHSLLLHTLMWYSKLDVRGTRKFWIHFASLNYTNQINYLRLMQWNGRRTLIALRYVHISTIWATVGLANVLTPVRDKFEQLSETIQVTTFIFERGLDFHFRTDGHHFALLAHAWPKYHINGRLRFSILWYIGYKNSDAACSLGNNTTYTELWGYSS